MTAHIFNTQKWMQNNKQLRLLLQGKTEMMIMMAVVAMMIARWAFIAPSFSLGAFACSAVCLE